MFTGLIREMATVKSYSGDTLSLRAEYKPKLGDSVAINGACLSVVNVTSDGFSVELSPETQKLIAVDNLKGKVHIEPAMMMGDRFEGHIVQGHIDTVGTISQIKNNGNSYDVFVEIDPKFIPYIVPKGSITIDGVSLTVNEVLENSFRLTIIPITMKETLFGTYRKGSRVNIETDMFARYIEHLLRHRKAPISWDDVDKINALY
ncbi:MAG: riboflavin synthase [Epsilonproteobacteria bacterium]|nr:MAG: riboflavin synthase [Campylobacterota bacterium]